MSLKDEVNYVKKELSSDEKVLESAFKVERLYKKHKIKIWSVVTILIFVFVGNTGMSWYHNAKLTKANDALLTLQKNPEDTAALASLKENNPKLHSLFLYAEATTSRSSEKLEALDSKDPLLADIGRYHLSVVASKAGDSRYYQELVLIEEAYLALKEGKKDIAKQKLAFIGENSPVSQVARLLRHYTVKGK